MLTALLSSQQTVRCRLYDKLRELPMKEEVMENMLKNTVQFVALF
jgi:hypothetical protein